MDHGLPQPDAPAVTALLFSIPHGVEILVILLVVLVLFGNRLPGMARSLGRSFTEFKKGIRGEGEEPQQLGGDGKNARVEDRSAAKESTRP